MHCEAAFIPLRKLGKRAIAQVGAATCFTLQRSAKESRFYRTKRRSGRYDLANRGDSHVWNGGLNEIEHRVDIDAKGQIPFFVGDVLEVFE